MESLPPPPDEDRQSTHSSNYGEIAFSNTNFLSKFLQEIKEYFVAFVVTMGLVLLGLGAIVTVWQIGRTKSIMPPGDDIQNNESIVSTLEPIFQESSRPEDGPKEKPEKDKPPPSPTDGLALKTPIEPSYCKEIDKLKSPGYILGAENSYVWHYLDINDSSINPSITKFENNSQVQTTDNSTTYYGLIPDDAYLTFSHYNIFSNNHLANYFSEKGLLTGKTFPFAVKIHLKNNRKDRDSNLTDFLVRSPTEIWDWIPLYVEQVANFDGDGSIDYDHLWHRDLWYIEQFYPSENCRNDIDTKNYKYVIIRSLRTPRYILSRKYKAKSVFVHKNNNISNTISFESNFHHKLILIKETTIEKNKLNGDKNWLTAENYYLWKVPVDFFAPLEFIRQGENEGEGEDKISLACNQGFKNLVPPLAPSPYKFATKIEIEPDANFEIIDPDRSALMPYFSNEPLQDDQKNVAFIYKSLKSNRILFSPRSKLIENYPMDLHLINKIDSSASISRTKFLLSELYFGCRDHDYVYVVIHLSKDPNLILGRDYYENGEVYINVRPMPGDKNNWVPYENFVWRIDRSEIELGNNTLVQGYLTRGWRDFRL